MKEVYSSPYDELPLKSDKYAAICTDIHLGNRGITRLQGFEKFISLDTVWLNNNKLQSIEGLEDNVRLKGLHLYCNKIRKFDRYIFAPYKFLKRLTLNDNYLDDMESVLKEIKVLRNLLSLDLFNNPIAEEDNYRLRVLAAVPSLEIFDRHRVTDEEKIEVHKFKEKMKKLKHFDLSSSTGHQKKPEKNEVKNENENAMKDLLCFISTHAKEKRCFIELSFLDFDRRHLGIVEEDLFWKILHDYGLSQILSENEKRSLMAKYKRTAKVESISTTGTLPRCTVNYRRFCRDILPHTLRVIKDENEWKTDRVPEISVTAKALEKYVRTVRAKKLYEETETKKRMMFSGNSDVAADFNMVRKSNTDCGLNPWEVNELSRIIATIELENNGVTDLKKKEKTGGGGGTGTNSGIMGEGMLSRQQCENIFKLMRNFKKVPELGAQHSLHILFKNTSSNSSNENPESRVEFGSGSGSSSSGNSGIKSTVFRASVGCVQRTRTLNSAPPVRKIESAKGTRPVSVSVIESKPYTEIEKLFRNPPIVWRDMSEAELGVLEDSTFEQSNELLDKLLRARGKDDLTELTAQTISMGITATRLGGQKVRKPLYSGYDNSAETVGISSNRADVIILPNLKKTFSLSCVMDGPLKSCFNLNNNNNNNSHNNNNNNSHNNNSHNSHNNSSGTFNNKNYPFAPGVSNGGQGWPGGSMKLNKYDGVSTKLLRTQSSYSSSRTPGTSTLFLG